MLACTATATEADMPDAGVNAQRGEVGDPEAERGQDKADRAAEDLAQDQDEDQDHRELGPLHNITLGREGGRL